MNIFTDPGISKLTAHQEHLHYKQYNRPAEATPLSRGHQEQINEHKQPQVDIRSIIKQKASALTVEVKI